MLSLIAVALLMLLGGGAVLTASLMMSRRARLDMEQRVNLITGVKEKPKEPETLGELVKVGTKKFDMSLRNIFAFGFKRTWALRASSLLLLLAAGVSAGVAWLLSRSFFGLSPILSAVISVGAAFLAPRLILFRQQSRAEAKFIDLFPDAVDTIARMIRVGLPISAAVRTVAIEAQPPVGTVFGTIADQLNIGVPIEDLLDASSKEIGLPDFRFFTVAIGLQYATGGNLTKTLEILSDIIRKRRATRLKAKAATGEIRITAYTLAGIPVLTVLTLTVVQPGYLTPLWTDPRGHWILAMAGGLILMAFLSMRAMMRSVTKL
jgi:tight adherence protein B